MIEIIHATYICKYSNLVEAERHLSKYPANIRIDLHGVLDVISPNVSLSSKNKVACISFVGENTRNQAVKDIQERIHTGQIEYGVLVFVRGKGKERFTFTEVGSKAWVNQHIPCEGPCIFVDDSTDHLRSTKYLIPDMTCTLFNTGNANQLRTLIAKWEH